MAADLHVPPTYFALVPHISISHLVGGSMALLCSLIRLKSESVIIFSGAIKHIEYDYEHKRYWYHTLG